MYSENNDYDSILARLLERVPDTLDKREGSIIYDALAPAAAELANCYITMDIFKEQTNLLTALGENLDNKVVEVGISRIQATPAIANIEVKDSTNTLMTIPIGSRFAVPNEYGGFNFVITEEKSTGEYYGECETLGTDGNGYTGELLPLQSINNLGSAVITSIEKNGEDTESDTTLRNRAITKLNQEAFAGNKAAYREMAIAIDGVEDCKVFPVWDGGGTVKLAMVGPNHTLLGTSAIEAIQNKIDPIQYLVYKCVGSETGAYHFSYNGNNYQFTMPTIVADDILRFNTITLKLYKGTTEITTTSGTSGTELTFTYEPATDPQGKGVGMAPIGHEVTVVSPTAESLTITATLTLNSGAVLSQIKPAIKDQIANYIYQVQNDFVDKDVLIVYLSKISAAILNVPEVQNVSAVKINNTASDKTINNAGGSTVKYPIFDREGSDFDES